MLISTILYWRWHVTNKRIPDIYNSLQEIAWHFGSHGINGECCGDLSFVEFMALKKVHGNNDFSIQEIGNALNFTKSGATRIINRLENKGYVIRENSPLDGRICCVSITDKGTKAILGINRNYTLYLDELMKELNPNTIEQIKTSMDVLVKAVQNGGPFNLSKSTLREDDN